LRLGEAAAISVLRYQSNNYVGEDFEGFTITKSTERRLRSEVRLPRAKALLENFLGHYYLRPC
jgi:hypothetical protein